MILNKGPQVKVIRYLLRWTLLPLGVAVLAGSASAAFLALLDWATLSRQAQPWLYWGLPVVGFVVGWIYWHLGQDVERGNNLLIDEVHDPKKIIPLRMAPLILGSTVASHVVGASVGREGTAVQMGGALADQFTHIFKFTRDERRLILMAGISAGFASVFGTPLAGAIFGLEVLAVGRLRYDALWPCAVAAVVADWVCSAWGIHHTHYATGALPMMSGWILAVLVFSGALFGLTGQLFARMTHTLSAKMKQWIAYAPLRPLIGGVVLVLLMLGLSLQRYAGLGIDVMQQAFTQPLAITDFVGKLLLTAWSLGTGFKGGEVTPLFFMGATLGNTLAGWLQVPIGLLAGVGFVAVFAGAANTPLACTLMAMELFGAEIGIYAFITCVVSYLFSGKQGIYSSQLKNEQKHL